VNLVNGAKNREIGGTIDQKKKAYKKIRDKVCLISVYSKPPCIMDSIFENGQTLLKKW
jgi:hypothetical protein